MNAIRGGMFYDIPKRSVKVPPPWKYNIKQKWILGYKNNQRLGDVTPRKLKQSYFKWVDHKAAPEDFEKGQKLKAGKPNMKAKKYTFIDKIITEL